MGYRGGSNHADQRDKEFERSFKDKPTNKVEVMKSLDKLFAPKPGAKCLNGHAWIRDWDGVQKCANCKIPRPAVA